MLGVAMQAGLHDAKQQAELHLAPAMHIYRALV